MNPVILFHAFGGGKKTFKLIFGSISLDFAIILYRKRIKASTEIFKKEKRL